MKSLKLTLADYAPFLLLLPFSVTICLYVIYTRYELLKESHIVLYMYLGVIVAPVIFLFSKRTKISAEFLEIFDKYIQRLYAAKAVYILIGGLYSIVFLWAASKHIATYVERDRWILDRLPLIPFDPPILPRMAMIISWFTQPDMAVPLLGLFFALFWFSFLIYAAQDKFSGFLFWGALSSVTYLNGTFFDFIYANMELPAAIVAFIGLYGIWRGKYNVGLFFLTIGGGFKNTGIFFLITGAILFVYICLRERSVWKIMMKVDASMLVFAVVYPILNHWGSFYYALAVRGGPDYLVASKAIKMFWISSFVDLVVALFSVFTPLFVLGLLGAFLDKENKTLALFTLGILISLRSLQGWVDGLGSAIPYSMILIPALSFFSIHGLSFLIEKTKAYWMRIMVPVIFIVIGFVSLLQMLSSFPGGMSRLNSNFDAYVRKLAARFPDTGTIYQNDISLIPYILRQRGGDLDAILFRMYPTERKDYLLELSQPGCKLIIAERRDLATVSIMEADMISMGYSEHPYTLTDQSGTWVSYSKECNAWEYAP